MPRLIWVFAGRTLNLFVLSCRGSLKNIYIKEISRWTLSRVRWLMHFYQMTSDVTKNVRQKLQTLRCQITPKHHASNFSVTNIRILQAKKRFGVSFVSQYIKGVMKVRSEKKYYFLRQSKITLNEIYNICCYGIENILREQLRSQKTSKLPHMTRLISSRVRLHFLNILAPVGLLLSILAPCHYIEMSPVTRNPIFGISDKVRLKSGCSESWNFGFSKCRYYTI